MCKMLLCYHITILYLAVKKYTGKKQIHQATRSSCLISDLNEMILFVECSCSIIIRNG